MRRGRRPRRIVTGFDVNITSMMDMFTLILIFLLYFFDPDSPDSEAIELATSALLAPAPAELRVTVTKTDIRVGSESVLTLTDGQVPTTVSRDGRVLTPLADRLAALATDPGAPGATGKRVTVACDRDTPYALVADVLISVQAAGYDEYRFLVQTGDPASPASMTTP